MEVPDASPAAPLAGLEILLVEDEAIIALMVEDLLPDLGCARVWHASRIDAALKLIEERRPGAAILDVNLGGNVVFPVAERLEAAGTPFVFTTGYERDIVPARWRGRPFLQKPIESGNLAAALRAALGR
jgi:DNA-binding response OmpR family regulator